MARHAGHYRARASYDFALYKSALRGGSCRTHAPQAVQVLLAAIIFAFSCSGGVYTPPSTLYSFITMPRDILMLLPLAMRAIEFSILYTLDLSGFFPVTERDAIAWRADDGALTTFIYADASGWPPRSRSTACFFAAVDVI